MCARVFLPVTPEELAELLDIDVANLPPVVPRYNIAPGQDVLIARRGPDGGRVAAFLRWGLLPRRSPGRGDQRLINVRSESAARQPGLRDMLRERRCLVPAAGFYEWKKEGAGSQPYALRSSRGLVALGGLCGEQETFSVLTTEANAVVAPIHDRMPVILEREQFAAWLDAARPEADVHDLMRPYPAERLFAEPVSTRVNRPDKDDALCLEPTLPRQGRLF